MVLISILLVTSAHAASKAKSSANKFKPSYSELGTNFEFSGSSVTGKYQKSGEGLSVVENEKILQPLVQPRQQFRDRMKTSVRWNQ